MSRSLRFIVAAIFALQIAFAASAQSPDCTPPPPFDTGGPGVEDPLVWEATEFWGGIISTEANPAVSAPFSMTDDDFERIFLPQPNEVLCALEDSPCLLATIVDRNTGSDVWRFRTSNDVLEHIELVDTGSSCVVVFNSALRYAISSYPGITLLEAFNISTGVSSGFFCIGLLDPPASVSLDNLEMHLAPRPEPYDGYRATHPHCCGDGIAEGDEQCDDGNTDDGDGCAAVCTIEDAPPVPAVGEWGMSIMGLLLLTSLALVGSRRLKTI